MRILGENTIKEIRESMRGLNGTAASAEAERLAKLFNISISRIYEITKDLRPKRKPRADKGKRIADLMSDDVLKQMASWVVTYDITPADAFETARQRGLQIPVELPTFQRYMREHDLNKKARRNPQTPHRTFEASAPGELFQFDISGSKQRWYDLKTRKILTVSELEVSENHPNTKATRVKVWRFKLIDDFSRRVFTRYYAVDKANSSHVIDFLLQAYSEIGVPLNLYTDNDSIIKFGRNADATKVIDKALSEIGGYNVFHHLPGNARATGKIERQHQNSEAVEKLIGLFLDEGRILTLEDLQTFARNTDTRYNSTRHRTTGETPMARWQSKLHTVRMVDYQILKSAFLADSFDITLKGDLTFELKGKTYQLPTDQVFQDLLPRQAITKKKLKVIFADDTEFYTFIDFDLNEYDIQKSLAVSDVAGDFKSTAFSRGERNRKELKQFAKENAKQERERKQQGIMPAPIPYFDSDVVVEKTNTIQFPKPTVDVTPQIIEHAPMDPREKEIYSSKIGFWDAVREYESQFKQIAECKDFLDSLFANRDEVLPKSEIEDALKLGIQQSRLRLAK